MLCGFYVVDGLRADFLDLTATPTRRPLARYREGVDALLLFLELGLALTLLLLLQFPDLLVQDLVFVDHVAERDLQLRVLCCQHLVLLDSHVSIDRMLLRVIDCAAHRVRHLIPHTLQLELQLLILAAEYGNLLLLCLIHLLQFLVLLVLVQQVVYLLLLLLYDLIEFVDFLIFLL